jgi:rfaE bifunctional protein nucleotidyltransferase chain/domain
VDPAKRWKEYSNRKVVTPDNLRKQIESLRKEGKTIATINGSFDLMHAGHLFMLYEAAQQCDVLIVALNSDASIRAYKSKDRPIIPLKERIELMSAIEFVDYITWFEETDPRAILEIVRPDVHVNGAEYGENCIEAEVVRKNGGKLFLVPRIAGLATSDIVKKIKSLTSV